MTRGAGEPSTKRAKVDEADEEEDPLMRRKEELVRLLEEARAKSKDNARAKKELSTLCERLEAKNDKLLRRLPPELWQKTLDENLHQNDLFALAMTCRFFREKQKDLGRKLETNLGVYRPLKLRMGGRMPSHSLGWFRWFCDTFEFLPGYEWDYERAKGAMYEGDLVNYAALQGSVESLRWLLEEKGYELNEKRQNTGFLAGWSGSIEVLEFMRGKGHEFDSSACGGAARGGRLGSLKFLRGLDPPCPWNEWTCFHAAIEGHLEVLKWLRDQDPPCPWNAETCTCAAKGGHLDVLKWARGQAPPCPWNESTCADAARGGRLDILEWLRAQHPPCPWSRRLCRWKTSILGHQHIVQWIDQQEDESHMEE